MFVAPYGAFLEQVFPNIRIAIELYVPPSMYRVDPRVVPPRLRATCK